MSQQIRYRSLLLLALVAILVSCAKEIKHLSPGDIEDVLYDYHIAQNIPITDDDRDYQRQVNFNAVLKKHGVSREKFDSSMVYYLRHADKLQKIYTRINERMSNEALNLGANIEGYNLYSDFKEGGDTANIYRGEVFSVLSNYVPYNKTSFRLKADTAYHKGDKFVFELDSKFHYQDGYRNATIALALTYDNDSVMSTYSSFSSDSHQRLTLDASDSLKLKSISGFVIMNNGRNETRTTLKLIFLSNVRLIRCHQQPAQESESESTDSVSVSEQKDTISSLENDKSIKIQKEKES